MLMHLSFTLTAKIIKLFLRTELFVVPVGNPLRSDETAAARLHVGISFSADSYLLADIFNANFQGVILCNVGFLDIYVDNDRCEPLRYFKMAPYE